MVNGKATIMHILHYITIKYMYINIMHNILYGNDVHIKLNLEKYFFILKC